MSEIKFDREIARDLQRELSDLMARFEYNPNGADYYECSFCFKTKSVPLHGWSDAIQHAEDCLGMRALAELDKRLME